MNKLTTVFSSRIKPRVYLFDIFAANDDFSHSALMGRVIVNATEESEKNWKYTVQGYNELGKHAKELIDNCKEEVHILLEIMQELV